VLYIGFWRIALAPSLVTPRCGLIVLFVGLSSPVPALEPPVFEPPQHGITPFIWDVGALCRAVADTLTARFDFIAVRGEITGFSRAASGHCYFTLKDAQGQIRCAMFRRAASQLDFTPRDGEQVEVRGQLGVYPARGDLQFIIETMQRAGQGALFEQFLRLKAQLQAEGLFDSTRKRPLPALPRGIGLITSLGAAALHDVATTLQRRVPHIPVILAPAQVQGAQAPASIVNALQQLATLAKRTDTPLDVILLVRGGGAIEDLAAFNDERVARYIAAYPLPVICGVGHESDFTIADFCADVRAPTPTAAAELVTQPRSAWLNTLRLLAQRIQTAAQRQLDIQHLALDAAMRQLERPATSLSRQQLQLTHTAQRLHYTTHIRIQRLGQRLQALHSSFPETMQRALTDHTNYFERAALRLELLDPNLVLQRGYALLQDTDGHTISTARQVEQGQMLHARLAQGQLEVRVTQCLDSHT